MGSDVRVVLRHWLGADVRVVERLSDDALEKLHAALVGARERQARALAAASDEALRQMPPMVRGTVSRLLGR